LKHGVNVKFRGEEIKITLNKAKEDDIDAIYDLLTTDCSTAPTGTSHSANDRSYNQTNHVAVDIHDNDTPLANVGSIGKSSNVVCHSKLYPLPHLSNKGVGSVQVG
jgi:hypothetical protein